MPPSSSSSSLHLSVHTEHFWTHQLPPSSSLPQRVLDFLSSPPSISSFLTISRTPAEITIVCNFLLKDDGLEGLKGVGDTPWKCISVQGPMDFSITGVMCDITTPLKAAAVPIFAVSTWNTDYILVPADKIKQAVAALKNDGWTISYSADREA